jgi:hypothetical protein
MKSVWQKSSREDLERRLDRLTPDTRPLWGKFTAPQMVAHLIEGVRMALGEVKPAPRDTPFKRFPLKQIIIYLAPFPKGAPTAPELLVGVPQEWNGQVQRLKDLMARFAGGSHKTLPEHPAFGKLSRTAWGVLAYKHMDHHLRQFGV